MHGPLSVYGTKPVISYGHFGTFVGFRSLIEYLFRDLCQQSHLCGSNVAVLADLARDDRRFVANPGKLRIASLRLDPFARGPGSGFGTKGSTDASTSTAAFGNCSASWRSNYSPLLRNRD